MASTRASKLLPIASLVVFLMVLFIGFKSCSQDDDEQAGFEEAPQAPAPDADSPADTIRTLTAEVAAIKSQNKALAEQNADLLRQKNEITSQVRTQVREDIRKEEAGQRETAYRRLTGRLADLQNRLESMAARPASGGADDIPVGLGIGPDDGLEPAAAPPALVWVEPLDAPPGEDGGLIKTAYRDTGSLLHEAGEKVQSGARQAVAKAAPSPQDSAEPEPAYTVPRNATLIGATGMTALIGRIPFEGKVQDPFPFKVLVGRDNLAANGLEIPGVFGMVFSGTTTGDWTLSCARGDVTSVTYVFDDGTIRTLSSDDNSLARRSRAREGGGGGNQNRPIGWISDRRGIPCVTGKRISNASSFLAARIFAKGLEAGAQAFGQSQTTRQVSPLTGVNTTTVTGDTGEYVASQIASGGVGEISDYLRERMAQSFDVIYVDTGGELAVHIDRELPIDYEPDGRKLTYARKAIHTRRDRLD